MDSVFADHYAEVAAQYRAAAIKCVECAKRAGYADVSDWVDELMRNADAEMGTRTATVIEQSERISKMSKKQLSAFFAPDDDEPKTKKKKKKTTKAGTASAAANPAPLTFAPSQQRTESGVCKAIKLEEDSAETDPATQTINLNAQVPPNPIAASATDGTVQADAGQPRRPATPAQPPQPGPAGFGGFGQFNSSSGVPFGGTYEHIYQQFAGAPSPYTASAPVAGLFHNSFGHRPYILGGYGGGYGMGGFDYGAFGGFPQGGGGGASTHHQQQQGGGGYGGQQQRGGGGYGGQQQQGGDYGNGAGYGAFGQQYNFGPGQGPHPPPGGQ